MSYSGTVRCGNCYTSGHNRNGCPELKAAWEKDPESWQGKQWQRIIDRKAKPKICGYCDESGHTRAQCQIKKTHMGIYQMDLNLWRQAIAKWTQEVGLGVGALVRANNSPYSNTDHRWVYPNSENYVAPVGMVMSQMTGKITHYYGIMNATHWLESTNVATMDRLGSDAGTDHYKRVVGLGLPSIPGIVTRMGKGYWGGEQIDRDERVDGTQWEIVSPAPAPFDVMHFTDSQTIRALTKAHFSAKDGDAHTGRFYQFTDAQRAQLQDYVAGRMELSKMIDPQVPTDDT